MGRHWIAAALLVLAAPSFAQQLKPLDVNVFREDPPLIIGRLKGQFAAEGLAVKVVRTANSTDQMRGLSNGTFHVVSTAFDNVLGWSGREGAELIAISSIIDNAVFPVFVRPEIKTWNDLRGKKLAADAINTAFALVLRRVLLDKGLDYAKGDYELVAVGNTGLRLQSLLKGETMAGIITPPDDVRAAAQGLVRMGDSKDVLPDFPNTIFATNRAWAEKQRPELVAFLRGWLASLAWMRANPAEAAKIVQAELKVDAKVADSVIRDMTRTGALNRSGLEQALKLRTGFGLTPTMGADVARYFDTSFFDAAARR
jgi:ABC-type nitrate/sulfonate/bicarbonate transport system substrate-binding protein